MGKRFVDIINDVFRANGYTTQYDRVVYGISGDTYQIPLLVNRYEKSVGVYYKAEPAPVTKFDLSGILNALKDGALTEGIYISASSFDNEVRAIGQRANIELWDREKLVTEIGRAVLNDVDESTAEHVEFNREAPHQTAQSEMYSPEELIVPAIFDDGPMSAQQSTAPAPAPSQPMDYRQPHDPAPAYTPPAYEEPVPRPRIAIPESTTTLIVRPKAKKEDIMAIASVKVRTIGTAQLILVPYYVFDFTCKVKIEGLKAPREVYGTIRLNAVTKDEEEWHRDFQVTTNLKSESSKLDPKFDAREAAELARLAVVAVNTRTMEIETKRGFTTLFESRKARPYEETIEISDMKLYYVPVWTVQGSNGFVDIDATDGKILNQSLYEIDEI